MTTSRWKITRGLALRMVLNGGSDCVAEHMRTIEKLVRTAEHLGWEEPEKHIA